MGSPLTDAPHDPSPRRLVRLPSHGRVAGVAAGIAWYLGVDPTVVRIAFVVMVIATGVGIPVYAVAWLLMPKGSTDDNWASMTAGRTWDARSVLITGGLAAAVLILLGQIDLFSGPVLLAALLIGGGTLLFNDGSSQGLRPGTATAAWGRPAGPLRPSASGPDVPPAWADVPSAERRRAGQSAYGPYAGRFDTPSGSAHQKHRKRPPSILGRVGIGALLLVGGVVALLGLTVDGARAAAVPAIALFVVGATLLVGTFFGRARWLVPVGVGLSLLLVATSFTWDFPLDGGIGERSFAPADVDAVRPTYDLLVGEQIIDLTDVDLAGQDLDVQASIAAGRLEIVLPADGEVRITGTLRAGDYDILGETREGSGLSFDVTDGAPDEVDASSGRVTIEVDAGLAEIDITRAARR